jgi:hypothetical protein
MDAIVTLRNAVINDTLKLFIANWMKPALLKISCDAKPMYPSTVGDCGIQTGGYVKISLRSLNEVDTIHKNGINAEMHTIITRI